MKNLLQLLCTLAILSNISLTGGENMSVWEKIKSYKENGFTVQLNKIGGLCGYELSITGKKNPR